MATHDKKSFLTGVIEGFYGKPWSQTERFELFDWMAGWGLNTYLYAPKDDLKHRAIWRELYSAAEAETLGDVIRACKQRSLRFIYALSPGLDIRYSNEAELEHLRKRFEQMLTLGCQNFALLFDDIPDRMAAEDQERWGSFASAQCHVANAMFRWTRERSPEARFLFCPTPYCGRMAERKYGGEGYLSTIGRELLPEIDVFWTGPEIISREIPVTHIQELQATLCRKPLIWDNLHANDYDGRRFYCGPYAGRPPELRSEVRGLLVNPNNEFPLNFVPLHTLAEFVRCDGTWNARKAYLSAMREWLPHFATIGQPVTLEDLVLFGDCYYLPHGEGPEAEALFERARSLLAKNPAEWGEEAAAFRQQATRLREFCSRMTELRYRPLFYALSRRIWELREELDLLDRYVEFKSKPGQADTKFGSDFHLPDTYRGGMVPRLQRLLRQQANGLFLPTRADSLS
ncbi:MAG: beta-N-acetylglucosaminidase domain-containing protein [Verrucomicrobiota bacterium]